MKYLNFDGLMELVKQAPHRTLSTKTSKKAITYSVQVGDEKIDFRVSKKLARIEDPSLGTSK